MKLNSLTLSLGLFCLPLAAVAQDEMKETTLKEVVVNGTSKSTQNIEKQCVSYTLLDKDFIEKNDVRDLQNLGQYVPSLEIPQYGSRLTSSMYIRGIGSRINAPSVGVYYEGIPLLFKTALNRHFYDINHMVVLRGPQGTLYGLNSEGGLVVLNGANPIDAVERKAPNFTAKVGFENHGGNNLECSFLFPITSNLAVSTSAFYHKTNGFQRNSNLKERADDLKEGGAKVKIAWNPSKKFRLSLFGDIQRVSQHGFCYGVVKPVNGNIYGDSIAEPSTNMLGSYSRTTFDAGLNAAYNSGRWRLQSITSFQYLNDDMTMDQDNTTAELMHLTQHQRGKAVTEELNLKCNISNKWLTSSGLYLAHQWLTAFAPVYFDKAITAPLADTIKAKMSGAMPPAMAKAISVDIKMQNPGEYRTPLMNLGVFHETHYDFTKDFSATIGLRYDFSRQDLKFATSVLTDANIKVATTEMARKITSSYESKFKHTYNQVLPKLSLKYKDYYFTVAKGYRAGGYNFQMFSDILQGELQKTMKDKVADLRKGDITFEHDAAAYAEVEDRISYAPELSWVYELGGRNTFGKHSSNIVNLRYSVFYSRVHDIQLSVMADSYGYGRMMKNAGKSTSCGGEINIDGVIALSSKKYNSSLSSYFDTKLVSPRLVWAASYGYTHTKFLENKQVPYIPNHTMNANLGIEWSRYSVQLNMIGRGKIYWDEENTLAQPFYTQFGARASADFGIIRASLWARNLLNYRPTTFAFSSSMA
ncbi:MAG: TonB-dependent receptor, partial [Bacteroidaceae bacterium]|nr:TonB-dependent receptor [Bacteroidaceae bacterium]